MKNIIFWQNIPSIHQSAMLKSLAESEQFNIILATESDNLPERENMGWSIPDFGKCQVITNLTVQQAWNLATEFSNRDSVHIVSGIHAYPVVSYAFRTLTLTNAWLGLYLESPDRRGIRGYIRRLRTYLQAAKYRTKIDFLLAIGSTAVKWYTSAGYMSCKVFPFAYWLDSSLKQHKLPRVETSPSIVFIGRLIECKGTDLLISALSQLDRNLSWKLTIVGDGEMRPRLQQLINKNDLNSRIHWHSFVPNSQIHDILRVSDLLVLPSTYDGWGAVVSEAISCGVPAVVSDACGSSDLVSASGYGQVFRSGSVSALAEAINSQLAFCPLGDEKRYEIQKWHQRIDGISGAKYLSRILDCVVNGQNKPAPPWLESKAD